MSHLIQQIGSSITQAIGQPSAGNGGVSIPESLSTGLLAWYTLNSLDGVDASGNGPAIDTDWSAGPTLGVGTGIIGNSWDFDGTQRRYSNRDAANAAVLKRLNQDVSISMWVYANAYDSSTDRIFFRTSSRDYSCLILNNPSFGLSFKAGTQARYQYGQFAAGAWMHLVVMHDFSELTNTIIVNNGTPTVQGSGAILDSYSHHMLGGDNTGATFNGRMCEHVLYDRPFSAEEVAALYNDGSGITYTDVFSA